jgi:hypothetical protein
MLDVFLDYLKHLFIGWLVLASTVLLLGSALPPALSWFLSVPGSAPFFPGAILLGLASGFALNRQICSKLAVWVFVPPLLLFALNARDDLFLVSGSGWTYFLLNELSNRCAQTECLGVAFFTVPLACAFGYSGGAWLALRRNSRGTAARRRRAALPMPLPPGGEGHYPTELDAPAPAAQSIWAVVGYAGRLWLATASAWFVAWLFLSMTIYSRMPGLFGGLLIVLVSAGTAAALGAGLECRRPSKGSIWVWPLPVVLQLAAAFFTGGTHAFDTTAHWWQAYLCSCADAPAVGLLLYSAVPAYGAVAFSLGALWARRRLVPVASAAPPR